MNALVDGRPDRELARLALTATVFEPAEAIAKFGGEQLQATRESLYTQLAPLKVHEPKLDGVQTKLLRKYLTVIGTAMMPTMSGNQANAWLDAVVMKLSDLPPRCAQEAASEAVHKAFGYIAEAEQFIRIRGDELHMMQRRAVARLDAMQAELHRAAHPMPALPDQFTGEGITDAQVHEWQRTPTGRAIVRMGLAGGFIQPAQLSEPLPPLDERNAG